MGAHGQMRYIKCNFFVISSMIEILAKSNSFWEFLGISCDGWCKKRLIPGLYVNLSYTGFFIRKVLLARFEFCSNNNKSDHPGFLRVIKNLLFWIFSRILKSSLFKIKIQSMIVSKFTKTKHSNSLISTGSQLSSKKHWNKKMECS